MSCLKVTVVWMFTRLSGQNGKDALSAVCIKCLAKRRGSPGAADGLLRLRSRVHVIALRPTSALQFLSTQQNHNNFIVCRCIEINKKEYRSIRCWVRGDDG